MNTSEHVHTNDSNTQVSIERKSMCLYFNPTHSRPHVLVSSLFSLSLSRSLSLALPLSLSISTLRDASLLSDSQTCCREPLAAGARLETANPWSFQASTVADLQV